MTTYLGKSCSFCLPRVPFVNCRQFMYLVISLLVLRAGYGIWLYQFLIIAYLFTFLKINISIPNVCFCSEYSIQEGLRWHPFYRQHCFSTLSVVIWAARSRLICTVCMHYKQEWLFPVRFCPNHLPTIYISVAFKTLLLKVLYFSSIFTETRTLLHTCNCKLSLYNKKRL